MNSGWTERGPRKNASFPSSSASASACLSSHRPAAKQTRSRSTARERTPRWPPPPAVRGVRRGREGGARGPLGLDRTQNRNDEGTSALEGSEREWSTSRRGGEAARC